MINSSTLESFYSKSGQLIHLRRILPDDTPFLVDIFEHMSSESRYQRYNQTLDHVAPNRVWQEALQIALANPRTNPGLIAFVDTPSHTAEPVGAVRLVEITPDVAEVAISIRDDFQNKGIGSTLMLHMANEARSLGYRRIVASIRNDNPAIWKVFSRLPFKIERVPDGALSEVTIYLDEASDTATTEQHSLAFGNS